jgi:hypothetical protein
LERIGNEIQKKSEHEENFGIHGEFHVLRNSIFFFPFYFPMRY